MRSKAEVLEEKKRTYDEFLASLDGIDKAQFDGGREPADEDWNPRDVAAHVAYWESWLAKALLALLIEATPFPGFRSYDRINNFSTSLRSTSSLLEVLDELEIAYSDVTAVVEEFISDAELDRTVEVAYPSRVEHKPISEILTSYIEHFSDHSEQVRAWRSARGT